MAIADILDLLRCPVCREPFLPAAPAGSVRCARSHSFDLGRPGYLNLLGRAAPANADTAAMIDARQRVQDAGHFGAVAAAITDLLTASDGPVLDCGAGTGYYLQSILAEQPDRRGIALDVSVAAVKRAARSARRVGAVVADAWQPLPVADRCCAAVLSVFAPRHGPEFARVLTADGHLITVTPEPDHLVEVRAVVDLLDIDSAKAGRLDARLGAHVEAAGRHRVRYQRTLDPGSVRDVIAMGPNAFHLPPDTLDAQLAAVARPLTVTFAVTINRWRPRG